MSVLASSISSRGAEYASARLELGVNHDTEHIKGIMCIALVANLPDLFRNRGFVYIIIRYEHASLHIVINKTFANEGANHNYDT